MTTSYRTNSKKLVTLGGDTVLFSQEANTGSKLYWSNGLRNATATISKRGTVWMCEVWGDEGYDAATKAFGETMQEAFFNALQDRSQVKSLETEAETEAEVKKSVMEGAHLSRSYALHVPTFENMEQVKSMMVTRRNELAEQLNLAERIVRLGATPKKLHADNLQIITARFVEACGLIDLLFHAK